MNRRQVLMGGAAMAVSSGALAIKSEQSDLKMRIATAEDDIGYCSDVFNIKPRIYVDGVEENSVVMADERIGKVTVGPGSHSRSVTVK